MKKRELRNVSEEGARELLTKNCPFLYKESYKRLRTNLEFSLQGLSNSVLMVTSSLPDEGKTTTAINLAISLSQIGKKVILLDCDFRKASVEIALHANKHEVNGLSEILIGKRDKKSSILVHPEYGFRYILAGPEPPNPVELLGSKSMQALLEKMRESYDYIICDVPPILDLADSTTLCKYCDGVLLVVRHNYALKDDVKKAKQLLDAVGAKILGVIFSQYNEKDDPTKKTRRRNHYGYYGYYGSSKE